MGCKFNWISMYAIYKRILEVNRSTSTLMLRGELGRYSLKSRIIIRNIRYGIKLNKKMIIYWWNKLIHMKKMQTEKRIFNWKYNKEN